MLAEHHQTSKKKKKKKKYIKIPQKIIIKKYTQQLTFEPEPVATNLVPSHTQSQSGTRVPTPELSLASFKGREPPKLHVELTSAGLLTLRTSRTDEGATCAGCCFVSRTASAPRLVWLEMRK